MTTAIAIGGEASNFLRVDVLGRTHPECSDYWDGNWVRCDFSLSVDYINANYSADIRLDELQRFQTELEAMNQTMKGKAEFRTMDRVLSLNLDLTVVGHLRVSGELRPGPSSPNRVLFCLENLDQTEILPLLRQLNLTLKVYPVMGSLNQ